LAFGCALLSPQPNARPHPALTLSPPHPCRIFPAAGRPHARLRRRGGEQTPVYSISFELYENGISRALILDYTDFTITGEMTSLEMKKEKPCP
jgi:hypothetical protein